MTMSLPLSMPGAHRELLDSLIDGLRSDERIVAVAAGGSFLTDSMDEYSDLDLVVVVDPASFDQVMGDRERIAATLGPLLVAFTGEHVGEPRLLICLYGPDPLLHVDLKFVSLADVAERVENPAVLWEREGQLSRAFAGSTPSFPARDPQWIEDRFWVWIHYAATKVGRGEILEAIDFLSSVRALVLGPLTLSASGARPAGVRKIEILAPEFLPHLRQTIAGYSATDCLRAVRACVDLYLTLRRRHEGVRHQENAERAVMAYLLEIGKRCCPEIPGR